MDLRAAKRQYLAVFDLRFCRFAVRDLQSGLPVLLTWQAPPAGDLALADQIHLWFLDLDHPGPSVETLGEALSADEMERARRFRFEADRRRFVIRRGVLRRLLGRYLGCPPADVRLAYNPFGKPGLAGTREAGGVQFSLSATADLVMYSFTERQPLGLDLEKVHPGFQWEEIVEALFHPAEADHLRGLPDPQRLKVFFQYWTIREAFVKAQGVGLRETLAQVNFAPVIRDGLRRWTDAAGSRWDAVSLEPTEGSVAALVVKD